jgi:hypothetical protein
LAGEWTRFYWQAFFFYGSAIRERSGVLLFFGILDGCGSLNNNGTEFILAFGVGDIAIGECRRFVAAAEHYFFTRLELNIMTNVPIFFGAGNLWHDELLVHRLLGERPIIRGNGIIKQFSDLWDHQTKEYHFN